MLLTDYLDISIDFLDPAEELDHGKLDVIQSAQRLIAFVTITAFVAVIILLFLVRLKILMRDGLVQSARLLEGDADSAVFAVLVRTHQVEVVSTRHDLLWIRVYLEADLHLLVFRPIRSNGMRLLLTHG